MTTLRVEGITKTYGRHRALGGVSLELRPGALCALLGPNGAGKSTLIGVLSTLVRPSNGRVKWGDAPPERGAIGLLSHESFLYGELDAVENLRFWGALYSVPDLAARVAHVLDDVGLDPAARTRPARTYSRGMTQRLALARALLPEPRILLLDEPFTGLDRPGAQSLARALARAKSDGRVVLVATHDLDALDGLAEQLVVLSRGKVVLDERCEAAMSSSDLRVRYFAAAG